MSFDALATTTITTKRTPAYVSGLRGDPVANLSGVKIHPPMPFPTRREQEVRSRLGITGQAVKIHQTFTEKQSHTDSSVVVNQVPDIIEGDEIVDGGTTYHVSAIRSWPATAGMTAFLEITLEERK